jgi:hypothetical protein
MNWRLSHVNCIRFAGYRCHARSGTPKNKLNQNYRHGAGAKAAFNAVPYINVLVQRYSVLQRCPTLAGSKRNW